MNALLMPTTNQPELASAILAMDASSALAEVAPIEQVIKGWTEYGYDNPVTDCKTALEVAGWLAARATQIREGWLDREHCYGFGAAEVQAAARWMRSEESHDVLRRNGVLPAVAA